MLKHPLTKLLFEVRSRVFFRKKNETRTHHRKLEIRAQKLVDDTFFQQKKERFSLKIEFL